MIASLMIQIAGTTPRLEPLGVWSRLASYEYEVKPNELDSRMLGIRARISTEFLGKDQREVKVAISSDFKSAIVALGTEIIDVPLGGSKGRHTIGFSQLPVYNLTPLADGFFLFQSENGGISVWNTGNSAPLKVFSDKTWEIKAKPSNNGKFIGVSSGSSLNVYSVPGLSKLSSVSAPIGDTIFDSDISDDGSVITILSGPTGNTLQNFLLFRLGKMTTLSSRVRARYSREKDEDLRPYCSADGTLVRVIEPDFGASFKKVNGTLTSVIPTREQSLSDFAGLFTWEPSRSSDTNLHASRLQKIPFSNALLSEKFLINYDLVNSIRLAGAYLPRGTIQLRDNTQPLLIVPKSKLNIALVNGHRQPVTSWIYDERTDVFFTLSSDSFCSWQPTTGQLIKRVQSKEAKCDNFPRNLIGTDRFGKYMIMGSRNYEENVVGRFGFESNEYETIDLVLQNGGGNLFSGKQSIGDQNFADFYSNGKPVQMSGYITNDSGRRCLVAKIPTFKELSKDFLSLNQVEVAKRTCLELNLGEPVTVLKSTSPSVVGILCCRSYGALHAIVLRNDNNEVVGVFSLPMTPLRMEFDLSLNQLTFKGAEFTQSWLLRGV